VKEFWPNIEAYLRAPCCCAIIFVPGQLIFASSSKVNASATNQDAELEDPHKFPQVCPAFYESVAADKRVERSSVYWAAQCLRVRQCGRKGFRLVKVRRIQNDSEADEDVRKRRGPEGR